MSEGILLELQFFGRAFVCGVFMMLLYTGLRIFRKVIRHNVLAVAVEDLLYWLVCAVGTFRMLYLENSGAVRGFAIAAVVLGMVLYLQFEKFLVKIEKKLQITVKRFIMNLK